MERQDVTAALRELVELRITPTTTEAEAMASMRTLGMFNQCLLGVTAFSGQTPWERHPDGDELLHVLEGAVEVTVLTADGPHRETVAAGSLFVVPSGLWHRQQAHARASLLFATAAETTETSWSDDPR
jgi:mannose-6-phosphate isomerase-like protein (cupin superfamily)